VAGWLVWVGVLLAAGGTVAVGVGGKGAVVGEQLLKIKEISSRKTGSSILFIQSILSKNVRPVKQSANHLTLNDSAK
jgi:hypothetical protein